MSNHLKTHTTAGVETFLELFRIEPGIPLDHAFDELSVLLGCIRIPQPPRLTLNCHLPSNGQEIRRDPSPQFPQ